MDWKLVLTTFGVIFIAELGDKTQFAALAAGSRSGSMLSTWLGVVAGLTVAGTIGVIAGSALGEFLPADVIKWVSGILFVSIGLWILVTPA